MRAVSVRVNEVIGVAGYVLPGTRVDVVATASPTSNQNDMTSKVVLANVQVLTAGTRMEQDQEGGKPMQVTVVTLLVTPEQAERARAGEHRGQDSARAPQPARPGRAGDARHQAGGADGQRQDSRGRHRPARRGAAPREGRPARHDDAGCAAGANG